MSTVSVVGVKPKIPNDSNKVKVKKSDEAKHVLRKYNNALRTITDIKSRHELYQKARAEDVQAVRASQPGFVTARSHTDKELRVEEGLFRWGVMALKLTPISDLSYYPEKLTRNEFFDYLPEKWNLGEQDYQMFEGIINVERNLPDQHTIERDIGLIVRKGENFFWLSVTKDISTLWDRKSRPVVIHDFSFNPNAVVYSGNLSGALCFLRDFKSSLMSHCNVIHHIEKDDDFLPVSDADFKERVERSKLQPSRAPYCGVPAAQLVSCEWYKNLALDRKFDFRNMLSKVCSDIGFDYDELMSSMNTADEFQVQMACFDVLRAHEAPSYKKFLEHIWLKERCCVKSVWFEYVGDWYRILTIREAASYCPQLRSEYPMLEYYHLGVRPFGTKIRSRGIAQKIAELSGYDWGSLSNKEKKKLVQIDWISVSSTVLLSDSFAWVSPFRKVERVYFPESIMNFHKIYCPRTSEERDMMLTSNIPKQSNFTLVPNMIMEW